MIEKTLILIKPDGVRRGLVGSIIERVERKGLVFEELQLFHTNREQATNHYSDYTQAPFFESLIEFITSGPLIAAVVSGERAIAAFRQLAGATDSVAKAAPGSIRGDFGLSIQQNLVHGSDSPESAAREIAVWFPHHQID